MTKDQVHQVLGVLPDDQTSISEFYCDNYDFRPSIYDVDRKWKSSSKDIVFSVAYDISSGASVAYNFSFGVTDTVGSEEFFDSVLDYYSHICSIFGNPVIQEEPDQYWFKWIDSDYEVVMSLSFKDNIVRLFVAQTVPH